MFQDQLPNGFALLSRQFWKSKKKSSKWKFHECFSNFFLEIKIGISQENLVKIKGDWHCVAKNVNKISRIFFCKLKLEFRIFFEKSRQNKRRLTQCSLNVNKVSRILSLWIFDEKKFVKMKGVMYYVAWMQTKFHEFVIMNFRWKKNRQIKCKQSFTSFLDTYHWVRICQYSFWLQLLIDRGQR